MNRHLQIGLVATAAAFLLSGCFGWYYHMNDDYPHGRWRDGDFRQERQVPRCPDGQRPAPGQPCPPAAG